MSAASSPASGSSASDSWLAAARLVAQWLDRRERIDALLDHLPRTLTGAPRARAQYLILGVVRHFSRIDSALQNLVAHPPRFPTRAALFIAGFELIESSEDRDDGRVAKIVHHAVEQTKLLATPAEARMVNAVVRKLATALDRPEPGPEASPEELSDYYSHPVWLVKSWLAQFGAESTLLLLQWNQRPAPVHARWRGNPDDVPPAILSATDWRSIYAVESGHWPEVEALLRAGKLYLQDPSTLSPIELLAPAPGETIIDLCAAPGGKSLAIADAMKSGRLVSVDLPGTRIDRLKENLSRTTGVEVALVQADMLKNIGLALREHRLPEVFDGVLLDVPCSNTGVMRHRIDVKWRLQPGDFKKHPQQQLSLLHAAARLVAPGGRLVYSTCSIDAEENEHVVRAFLASKAGGPFKLERSVLHYPWTSRHDGGGAFLLRRQPE